MEIPIKTTVSGINWPALPPAVAAGRLAVLFQLEQSQWWSEERLKAQQFLQANALLQYSVQNVPYYRERASEYLKTGTITLEQWQDIPLLTRDKVQQIGEALHTCALPASHGNINFQKTSGSTGKPLSTAGSDITRFFWNVFTLRDHFWQRRDFTDFLAVIRHNVHEQAKPPHGIVSTNWGSATAGLIETSTTALISINTPLTEQIDWLKNLNPHFLLTHPSVAQALALEAKKGTFELPKLREVRTISESLPDGLRELCQESFGAKLTDLYSTIEAGYIALQCPEHEHYHVQSENVLLEVLDDNDNPCAPGEVGKVVVTTLHNFAMPLIRYELGDYAEVGEPCACGRGLPVIKHILGRYRNMITLPDGERVWPRYSLADVAKIASVRQFQAVQHSIQEMEFKLVLNHPLSDQSRLKLIDLFKSNLHPAMNVTISEVDNIPRSASGKYEDFVSNL